MPSSTLDDLVEAYSTVSAVNRSILEQFTCLAREFRQAEIPFLLLKGADVISRLYGIRGTRPLSDVDLLVEERDLPAIDRLLTRRGFVQQIDGNPSYASSDLGLSLDLVTSLWYLDEQSLRGVWSRTITRSFQDVIITCLSTEDLLIHLTAYAVIHRGQLSAAFSQDLRLLIEKESPDWPALVSRARQYQVQMPLRHGLTHIRALFPAIGIPECVFSQLVPSTRPEIVQAWVFRKLVTQKPLPDIGHFLLWFTRPRGTKWSWIRHTLFPTPAFLSYRYGPVRSAGTTRLLRLGQLCAAGLALSGRLLLRLISPPKRPRP